MRRRDCLAALALPAAARAGSVAVVERGRSLQQAVREARDGDTIVIASGEHVGQTAVITQRELTLLGVGPRPVLRADGQHAEGKAIVVARGAQVHIENLEFRGARVPDGNGAGIRLERGRLTVRHCAFLDNEMGILTANAADAELRVEDCEFGQAPRHEGLLHHLLYAGTIRRLEVRGSAFSGGWRGHLIKSRARENHVLYNHVVDGRAGEASYELDLPNGGICWVVGNVFGQSALTQNLSLVAFGAEGNLHADSALYMAHNTLISEASQEAWFLRAWYDRLPTGADVLTYNNLMRGAARSDGLAGSTTDGNLVQPLDGGMPERNAVLMPSPRGRSLVPRSEFTAPVGTRPLAPRVFWNIGAKQD